MLNRGKSKVPSAVKDVIIVGIGVAIVLLGIRLAFDTNNPFYVVSSGSMVPTLLENDVLVVRDGGSFEELKKGDIIVFNKPDTGDRVIVHRIIDIYEINGERAIKTQGDANPASIPGTDYPIKKDDYIGKVVYVIPGVGVITKVISPPINYIIIAIILAILFFSRMNSSKNRNRQAAASSASPPPPPPVSPADPSNQPSPPPPSTPSSPDNSDRPPTSPS